MQFEKKGLEIVKNWSFIEFTTIFYETDVRTLIRITISKVQKFELCSFFMYVLSFLKELTLFKVRSYKIMIIKGP